LHEYGAGLAENEPMDVTDNTGDPASLPSTPIDREDAMFPAMNEWLQERLPDWPRVWVSCVRRTHAWRTPPRWSSRDWWEEIDAESVASACHAIQIFDPERGPSLASFVYHYVLSSALSRYRQEWTYALRYGLPPSSEGHPVSTDDVEERFVADQEEKRIRRLMTDLPENDRRLIESLYWDGRTETEVAGGLGISQQAVCKRKHKILSGLRSNLAKSVQK
jgi:RNA polymerase sigma factor (sigma-70 family)